MAENTTLTPIDSRDATLEHPVEQTPEGNSKADEQQPTTSQTETGSVPKVDDNDGNAPPPEDPKHNEDSAMETLPTEETISLNTEKTMESAENPGDEPGSRSDAPLPDQNQPESDPVISTPIAQTTEEATKDENALMPAKVEENDTPANPITDTEMTNPPQSSAPTTTTVTTTAPVIVTGPAYVPQFRFTTFAPTVSLPTRNVTSNFLKTDKNFVMKDLVSQRKLKRRKSKNDTVAEVPNSGTGEDRDADETETEPNGVKRSKTERDGLHAIRRGIFGEEEVTEEGDGNLAQDEENGEVDNDADSSSGSDSDDSAMEEADENGEVKSSGAGKRIIVIHPGSRFLRIGRASDAYPVVLPHVIARRMRKIATPVSGKNTTASGQTEAGKSVKTEEATKTGDDGTIKVEGQEDASESAADAIETNNSGNEEKDTMDMDVDEDEGDDSQDPDVVNDQYLKEIEYDLKQRMKAAKRRPVPNAKTQVRSFNSSSRPERILDHNDPYKVEWTDPVGEGDFIIGQKALNLPLGKNHTFKLFWPIVGGNLNDKDYECPRVVVSDLETIWTKVIQDDLGIEKKKFRKHYALLVIPDLYSKLYVVELVSVLLKSMGFKGVMVQQESVCASFGAGVSVACVVDIGAEVTKVACVEDGICIPNSRAMLKYGGDDITRCFSALVRRTGFPYADMDLSQSYDWHLMEELKEKWCTMNEADLTVQVYSFFVRKPDYQTEKYQVKVYDEVAVSPMCLFFPGVIRRWIEARDVNPSFTQLTNYEDINDDAPPVSLTNQTAKKSTLAAARAGTPVSTIAGDENSTNVAATNGANNTNNGGGATPVVGTPNPTGASAAGTPAPTPAPYTAAPVVTVSAPVERTIPFAMDPTVKTTDVPWEVAGTIGKDHFSSLVALDIVVAQSISNCGSEERSKKLYGSIILVGGGGMVKGFDRVLEDRLFQALPATLTTVEKVEVLPSPRDMDPRLLVWKGGSVLGKLETAKELWIKPLEWELLGRKVFRDKALFVWSKD